VKGGAIITSGSGGAVRAFRRREAKSIASATVLFIFQFPAMTGRIIFLSSK
jgi:diacylglycerol kinase